MDFLKLPSRELKPRTNGLTMAIDTGYGIKHLEQLLEVSSDYIDYVKLGWGTSLATQRLNEKLEVYKKWGIPVCLGGTLLEVAYVQNKIQDYCSFLIDNEINYVEISDGTVPMERAAKLGLIEKLAKDFCVLSEYGSKDDETVSAPHLWSTHMKEEIDAGAWKLIAEGRESGNAGMYRANMELRTGLIEEILFNVSHENIIWETPKKDHQTWFVKRMGSDVNLGNIALNEVIALETIRLGLRSDTLMHFHGKYI